MGEGMSVQIAPDGRRIIWLAHESAPNNFTAVDVSDPRKPKVICQTDLPTSHMAPTRWRPAGTSCGRLSDPEEGPASRPAWSVRHLQPGEAALDLVLRLLGPASARRAPALVLRRRIRPHGVELAGLRADASAGRPVSNRCIDVRNPSKPLKWAAGTCRHKQGDNVAPAAAATRLAKG